MQQQKLQRHVSRKTGTSLKHTGSTKLPPIAVAGAKPSSLSKVSAAAVAASSLPPKCRRDATPVLT